MKDWSNLRVLAAIVRDGSIAKAGRSLGIHAATVERRLTALEQQLGLKLIDRQSRRAVLTSDGTEVGELAAQVARLVDAITRRGRGGAAALAGTVTINAPAWIGAEFIAPGLAELLAAEPALQTLLRDDPLAAGKTPGEADIVVALDEPDAPNASVRWAANIPLGLYATYAIASTRPEEWRFIGHGGSGLAAGPHRRWYSAFIGGRPVVLQSDEVFVQLAAARAGLGVALLPSIVADRCPDLVRVGAAALPPSLSVWLMTHAGAKDFAAVQTVLDRLAMTFERIEQAAPMVNWRPVGQPAPASRSA